MNADDDAQTESINLRMEQSKMDESGIQLKTAVAGLEIEVFSDSELKQRIKLILTREAIEIAQGGRARVSLGLDHFMGVQLFTGKDVEKPSVKNSSGSIVLLQAKIVKDVVAVDRHRFFSNDASTLASFREGCLKAFYALVDPQGQHTASPRKRFLFFVSPKSGKGAGVKLFEEQKEYFEYAGS